MNIYSFEYNVNVKTVAHYQKIDFTYHINNYDFPIEHTHKDYWEFTIVTYGELDNYRNGAKEHINKKMMFISTTNDTHYLKSFKNSNITYINIIARESRIKEILDSIDGTFFDRLMNGNKVFEVSSQLLEIIDSNLNALNALSEMDWETANNILLSTVLSIISSIYLSYQNQRTSELDWQNKLKTLQQYSEFLTYNVSDLCEKLGYSRTQLNRIFNDVYGMTPHEYLLDFKMNHAASYLAYTDMPATTIAKMLGYSNLAQFTENFKAKYQDTPINYRNKRRGE